MDIKIINGDIDISASGEYSFVTAVDEALQRAVLCAKIKKGSFIYNKALGTELGKIPCDNPLSLKTAQMLLKEALMETFDGSLKVVSLENAGNGRLKVLIEVADKNEKRLAEVTFIADL